MAEGRYQCSICGVAGVPAPGRVCPLHLRASEQRLLVSQAKNPSAWILAAEPAAVPGPAAAEHEARPLAMRPAEPTASMGATELPLASVSQRFYAFVIDLFAATVIAAFLAAFASASPVAAVALGLGGWWGYFLLANSIGQLAGKATLGIKVIDPATGREPGFAKGTLRTMGQAIGLLLVLALGAFTAGIGIIVLMITWDERNVTIDDAMAGTRVVRTEPVRR
jgi:uncharacterized RDD family membrane protein YckC